MEMKTMEWSTRWAFWRRNEKMNRAKRRAGGSAPEGAGLPEPKRPDDWEARLIAEGVSSEWAPDLAKRLGALSSELGSGLATPMILTAAATVEVQAEAHAKVERNLRDVREVERLLGAFSGELEKLDEVLEVLSAYAQRMRTKPARKAKHTLH